MTVLLPHESWISALRSQSVSIGGSLLHCFSNQYKYSGVALPCWTQSKVACLLTCTAYMNRTVRVARHNKRWTTEALFILGGPKCLLGVKQITESQALNCSFFVSPEPSTNGLAPGLRVTGLG
jgi:hypothetical protein